MKFIYRLYNISIAALILSLLIFALVYFYIFARFQQIQDLALSVFMLAFLVDGLFVILHLFRKPVNHENVSFDPKKLSVLIACKNGEDIIEETIRHANKHVPLDQIIIIDDCSTDNTVQVVQRLGARVVKNTRNVNKAFSISQAIHHVKTPYVLILDDDTLIGNTFVPTSLLDDGYTAVAFNVMPVEENTLINKLQQYEYRKSMFMGKALRASAGAIGNISGAIGLYRTQDLIKQSTLHSGQFGGEDQQRTVFAHLYGEGKGITYSSSTVLTKAPATFSAWIKQRSKRWNLSLPELFVVYLRVIFSNSHYLLKTEKAYQMFLLLTDPLRMLLVWVILTHPLMRTQLYFYYLLLNLFVWFKVGRKDPLWVTLIYPLYTGIQTLCRFYAHFYWFKIKFNYIFKEKYHRLVPDRSLLTEYFVIMTLIFLVWAASIKITFDYVKSEVNSHLTIENIQKQGQDILRVVTNKLQNTNV